MAIGDAKITLTDGGVGRTPKGADGIHLKIGVAEGGVANKVYEASSYYDAKKVLKQGSLLDAIRVYFNEFSQAKKQTPVKILFARAEADVSGTTGSLVHKGTGTATHTTSGVVTGSRTFVIKITKSGVSGTAIYSKSSDGGNTFSEEITTPASGSSISLGAGVNIVFTDGATSTDSFVSGDTYTFRSTAPTASVANVLACVNASRQQHQAKFVHIMGATDTE